MNVLLISFSFPPAGGVGVLRAVSLAKYLPQHGIRVDVLTARNAPSVGRDTSLLRQIPAEVTIHQTWTPDLPFAWRKRLKGLLNREKSTPSSSIGSSKPGPAASALRTLVGNLLLPDPQVGWVPFAFRAARRIIASRQIDAVLITVPPFSSLRLTGLLRSAFPALPIIADFRDEWLTTTINLVSFSKHQRARTIARQTESAAIEQATAVVAVTEAAVCELKKRYPALPASKFYCVPNGFDGPLPTIAPARASSGRVQLVYMGTVYGSTAPQSFVDAVLSLTAELRSKLQIQFIGHIETATDRAALLSLGGTIELTGFVPQADALAALQGADFLLLISHDPINVSAKLYDYLGAGKPILAVVHPQGEVRRILERTHAGVWADVHSPASIAGMLRRAVQASLGDIGPEYSPDLQVVESFHRRHLTAQYAELLSRVTGKTS